MYFSARKMSLTHPNMCSFCLLVFTACLAIVFGQQNKPRNYVASKECYNYQINFAGLSFRRFYTCCKKPPSTGTESPCKEVTETVHNFKCIEPKSYEHLNVSKEYNCNGETGQKNAMKRCYSRWAWLEQDPEKPSCWAWSQCFAEACGKEEESVGLSIEGDFCGDGRCDLSTEDKDSCPIDCCPQDNPDICQVTNNTCPDACCGEALCCRLPPGSSSVGALGNILIWTIVGVAGFVVLLNIICCCCCVCCAKRCCKRHKKDKNKKKDKSTPV